MREFKKLIKSSIMILLCIIILAITSCSALAWTPTSNIDGRNHYTIFNFTNISATELYQDGHLVLTNESELNVNYSVLSNSTSYWDGLTSQDNITSIGTIISGVWQGSQIASAYIGNISASKLTSLDYLNYKVSSYWANITDRPTALSFFTDDLGARGYTLLSNFTDDLGDRGYTFLSNFTDDLDYSDKNVNSSTWWAGLSGWSSSMFEKVTNELSIKMSWLNTSIDSRIDSEQSRLNVNSSNYWDNLHTPSDINAGDINNDGTYISSTNESNLNVNSSNYWDNKATQSEITGVGTLSSGVWEASVIEDDYLKNISAYKLLGVDFLNYKILLDADNITDPFWIETADETNLNVNSSEYWGQLNARDEWFKDLNNTLSIDSSKINNTYDLRYISLSNESNLNVNSSNHWDGISSQSEITHTGNLTSLNVTGNVSAPWFNGQILWEYIANKFISAVGKYFFIDGSTLQMNTTELNATIDIRAGDAANVTAGDGIKKDGAELSVEAGNGLKQESSGLAVADAGINDTLMQYKLGQNLTSSDSPEFTDLTLSNELNPSSNTTFGKGWIINQGEYGCFDASCNHYIFENSSGVLIIV